MAECTGLENQRSGNGSEGSNPSLSAFVPCFAVFPAFSAGFSVGRNSRKLANFDTLSNAKSVATLFATPVATLFGHSTTLFDPAAYSSTDTVL